MKTVREIRYTNHAKQIFAQPVINLHPKARLKYTESLKELSINDALFYHVFDKLPTVRNIPANKQFFKSDIIHF